MSEFNWDSGLQGAAGGALTGAAAGAAAGPWGAAIGGVVGGGIGLFAGGMSGNQSDDEKKQREMLMDYYRRIQEMPTPNYRAGQASMSNDIRNRQITLADQLAAMGRGEGPSLAEAQLRSATDRNTSQQAGMANSGRGGAMAAGRAANNMALLNAKAAQDAAASRIQEQQGALNLLGLNLHGIRGSDEEMNRFNTQQMNEQKAANMWAQLKKMGMTDEASLAALSQLDKQNATQAGRTSRGEQLLAGGAGAFSQAMAMRSQQQQAAAYQQSHQGQNRTGE